MQTFFPCLTTNVYYVRVIQNHHYIQNKGIKTFIDYYNWIDESTYYYHYYWTKEILERNFDIWNVLVDIIVFYLIPLMLQRFSHAPQW